MAGDLLKTEIVEGMVVLVEQVVVVVVIVLDVAEVIV